MTSAAASSRAGTAVWLLARLAVQIFYRVQRIGATLPDGPVLLVANHPNSLLDPALVQATAGRPSRFLAKSTLFQGHFLSPLIRRSGAIPVHRRIDRGPTCRETRKCSPRSKRCSARRRGLPVSGGNQSFDRASRAAPQRCSAHRIVELGERRPRRDRPDRVELRSPRGVSVARHRGLWATVWLRRSGVGLTKITRRPPCGR